jgi:hypothetical protein
MSEMHALPFSYLDDDEFEFLLYEFANGPVRFDEDRLSCLVFNPLLYDCNNTIGLCCDLDAYSNFY